MPVQPNERPIGETNATPGRADRSVRSKLDCLGMSRSCRSSREVRIAVEPADGETVCEVEGAIDAFSAAHLAEALDVALSIEPANTVLLDLTRVDWMALLEVRSVMDKARRAHRDRTIVVRYTTSRPRASAVSIPRDTADGTQPALLGGRNRT
jgi:hypothetical protein